ncbi:MAG: ParA family protein [Spirochaetales bacterium]|jgi:chromosome partitioning protein|nr:ParA family protein [Spirochaetales bacterium]
MARIIVFVNQKGGVGKTTSAINIGAALASLDYKVLLIDFDPQGNLSSGVGGTSDGAGVYQVISGLRELKDVIVSTKVPGLFLAPSSIDLSGATVELVDKEDRNDYLKRAIATVEADYDFILVDCPPSLGILTLNGLNAANEVIIPLQCEYFALEGLSLILQTIGLVQKSMNPSLKVSGILLTMFDGRTKLSQQVVRQVSEYFRDRVFKTIVPRNIRLSEAPSHGLPVLQYDPACIGSRSYKAVAEELINRG